MNNLTQERLILEYNFPLCFSQLQRKGNLAKRLPEKMRAWGGFTYQEWVVRLGRELSVKCLSSVHKALSLIPVSHKSGACLLSQHKAGEGKRRRNSNHSSLHNGLRPAWATWDADSGTLLWWQVSVPPHKQVTQVKWPDQNHRESKWERIGNIKASILKAHTPCHHYTYCHN